VGPPRSAIHGRVAANPASCRVTHYTKPALGQQGLMGPLREAEWRFCAVGVPAWMPGEPRWAMDGPWRRAHGAGPERGNLSAAKAVRVGEAFLGTFVAVWQKCLAV